MTLYLTALGIANPLGRGKRAVAEKLFAGSRAGLVEQADRIPGRTVRVGAFPGTLPAVPDRLAHYDCRNNRLALAALDEIEPCIDAAIRRYGADRIAIVMGTSTAGMAEGEAAVRARRADGAWPAQFEYSQQELGNLAAFIAEHLCLSGPAYTIATACS